MKIFSFRNWFDRPAAGQDTLDAPNRSFTEVKKVIDKVAGWLSDREARFLFDTASRCDGRGVIVEIGSWQGKSTVLLATASAGSQRGKVFAIDPHTGGFEHKTYLSGQSSFEIFIENLKLADVEDMVVPIVNKSADAIITWNKPISFLWIDGDHSYAAAKQDFDQWSPFVVEGGVIAFHDSTQDEVPIVVYESFSKAGFSQLGLVDSIAYGRKISGAAKTIQDRIILFFVKYYDDFRRFKVFKHVKGYIKWLLARI